MACSYDRMMLHFKLLGLNPVISLYGQWATVEGCLLEKVKNEKKSGLKNNSASHRVGLDQRTGGYESQHRVGVDDCLLLLMTCLSFPRDSSENLEPIPA